MERKQLELIIDTNDEAVVKEIEESLHTLEVVRGGKARTFDPITILAIAAGAVQLVNELLTLQEKLKELTKSPKVTVRNLEGDSVKLAEATPGQLRDLLEKDAKSK